MHRIRKSIEINAPIEECFDFVSHFEHYSQFLKPFKSVQQTPSPNIWHWQMKGPFNKILDCDIHIDLMSSNEMIMWHTVHDSSVDASGTINFHKIDAQQTRIEIDMALTPPGGTVGEVNFLFENPDKILDEALNKAKLLLEHREERPKMPFWSRL